MALGGHFTGCYKKHPFDFTRNCRKCLPNIAHCIYFPSLYFKAQNSARPVDHSEIESLRKECEEAKDKAKKTLEKYFSESDRLKAIIDEQQGTLTFTNLGRRGLVVNELDSRSSGLGSSPCWHVVFLGNTVYSLFTLGWVFRKQLNRTQN